MLVGLPFTTTVLTGAIGKAQAIPEAHLPAGRASWQERSEQTFVFPHFENEESLIEVGLQVRESVPLVEAIDKDKVVLREWLLFKMGELALEFALKLFL